MIHLFTKTSGKEEFPTYMNVPDAAQWCCVADSVGNCWLGTLYIFGVAFEDSLRCSKLVLIVDPHTEYCCVLSWLEDSASHHGIRTFGNKILHNSNQNSKLPATASAADLFEWNH